MWEKARLRRARDDVRHAEAGAVAERAVGRSRPHSLGGDIELARCRHGVAS